MGDPADLPGAITFEMAIGAACEKIGEPHRSPTRRWDVSSVLATRIGAETVAVAWQIEVTRGCVGDAREDRRRGGRSPEVGPRVLHRDHDHDPRIGQRQEAGEPGDVMLVVKTAVDGALGGSGLAGDPESPRPDASSPVPSVDHSLEHGGESRRERRHRGRAPGTTLWSASRPPRCRLGSTGTATAANRRWR